MSPTQPSLAMISGDGTAAPLDAGTGPNQVVQLDGSGRLPAVDASLLFNLPNTELAEAGTLDLSSSAEWTGLPDGITMAQVGLYGVTMSAAAALFLETGDSAYSTVYRSLATKHGGASGATLDADIGTAKHRLTGADGDAAAEFCGLIDFLRVYNSTDYKFQITGQMLETQASPQTSTSYVHHSVGSVNGTQAEMNRIRLSLSTGSFTGGFATLYHNG